MHQRNASSQETDWSVWYKIPIWFQNIVCPKTKDTFPKIEAWAYITDLSDLKILSARKLKTLFQKYKLELTLQTCIHSCIGQVLHKYYREFLKDTTMAESHENVAWKSEFTFFQWLYSHFNSLTLSSASELFWSWISINHIQVHENDFCHCLFTDTQNVKLGIFTGSRAADSKEMYQKAWCTCKVVVLHWHTIAYLTFSSPPHLKLPIIYITSIYLSSRDKHSDQNNCQSLIEATKPQR